VVTPAVKREAVAHLKALLGLSERRACRIAGADRKMVRYQSKRAPDTVLRGRLRELANERRRFGYPLADRRLPANAVRRRLFVLLRREGEPSGINRIYRLYREEGLTVRKRKARRKAVGTRAPILVEARANARPSRQIASQSPAGRRDRWISSTTSSPMAGVSGFSTWSTTSPVNASPPSRTPRSRGAVWRVSWLL
jgi:hypothetical protein